VLSFHGPAKYSRDAENDLSMLSDVLRLRLHEVLREDLGGVYGVSVGDGLSRWPREEYSFTVSFGCAPENVEKLKKAVFDEVKALQEKGIADTYIEKVKRSRQRSLEVAMKDNGFWDRELSNAYRFGDDPRLIVDTQSLIDKVSSARVQAAAKTYLRDQYVLGVLNPEPGTPAAAPAAKGSRP
jgi:zinc protease